MTAKTRDQIAALPLRLAKGGVIEVLLVTSRETKRWIVPKGWPMKGLKDRQAAALEAQEEAGVKGHVLRDAIGTYAYWRRAEDHFQLCTVAVFALKVEKQLKSWKERGQRETRWENVLEAAHLVSEPELSTLIVRLPANRRVLKLLSKG
ncbi:MAG TPA: NUDIX hydrolase [Mesorhizobium sp.]|jgi:8-oxo-dGTP pyrophosphatase MutT (NUDIX family)|nr:NUDIX hydrolase [Mesorhizobium sp.]